MYPKDGVSIGSLRRELRGTLAKDKYIDVDIINAHPNIINQLLIEYNLPNISIDRYCSHRDELVKEVMTEHSVSRDDAKRLFIRALYGGKYSAWVADTNSSPLSKFDKHWSNIQREARMLVNLIKKENKALYNRYAKNKNFNLEFGFLSKVIQHIEREILEVMVATEPDSKILCHDGFMIESTTPLSKQRLLALETAVKRETNFDLKIINKELPDYSGCLLELPPKPEMPRKWKEAFMKNIETYEDRKTYFECSHAKIIESGEIIKLFNGRTTLYSMRGIVDAYGHVEESLDCGKKKKFIRRWLEDPDIKRFSRMDWKPFNGTADGMPKGDLFNTFSGYCSDIEIIPVGADVDTLTSGIREVILQLCEGNPLFAEFFTNWLAHAVQYPATKLPISIIHTGRQGTGKGMLFKALQNILGSLATTSSNPNDFMGTHATGVQEKILINMNECSSSRTFNMEANIKSLITEDTLILNEKYRAPRVVKNYARIWITSNKNNPINMDANSGDRRFVAFKPTSKLIGDVEFWQSLQSDIDNPEFTAAFYSYLNSINLRGYNFIEKRKECETEAYKDMKQHNTPAIVSWVQDLIDEYTIDSYDKEVKVRKTQLYIRYKQWIAKFDEASKPLSRPKWCLKLKELSLPIEFRRRNSGVYGFFTPANVAGAIEML